MDIAIRPATDQDANACGRICYEGFRAVNERYGFPLTFPSVDVATHRVGGFIRHPSVFGVVAEAHGRIVGFNFLSERDPIRAIGPIVVDPAAQGHGTGRQLMEAVLERARGARGGPSSTGYFQRAITFALCGAWLRRAGNSCGAFWRAADLAGVGLRG